MKRIVVVKGPEPDGPYACDCSGDYDNEYGPDNRHHFYCAILLNDPVRCPVQACPDPFKTNLDICRECGRLVCYGCRRQRMCHGPVETERLERDHARRLSLASDDQQAA